MIHADTKLYGGWVKTEISYNSCINYAYLLTKSSDSIQDSRTGTNSPKEPPNCSHKNLNHRNLSRRRSSEGNLQVGRRVETAELKAATTRGASAPRAPVSMVAARNLGHSDLGTGVLLIELFH